MKQAIAGVAPAELGEVTVMTVWPSISASPAGRLVGRLCAIGGQKNPLAPGKIFCVLLIPLALALYFVKLLPPPLGRFKHRYRLTNRRMIEEADRVTGRWKLAGGFFPVPEVKLAEAVRAIELSRFDDIDVEVLPGQAWFPAGDLIFRLGPTETFRLSGVQRPETFRHTALAAARSYVYVQRDVAAQA